MIRLYLDVHVQRAICEGLLARGVDVITAQEDFADRLADDELLDRATALGRIIFSHDRDFLREARRRQQSAVPFDGIIFAHQLEIDIGQCIRDLELIANVYEPADMINRVEYLPL